jgi:hypothetical protein
VPGCLVESQINHVIEAFVRGEIGISSSRRRERKAARELARPVMALRKMDVEMGMGMALSKADSRLAFRLSNQPHDRSCTRTVSRGLDGNPDQNRINIIGI